MLPAAVSSLVEVPFTVAVAVTKGVSNEVLAAVGQAPNGEASVCVVFARSASTAFRTAGGR